MAAPKKKGAKGPKALAVPTKAVKATKKTTTKKK